MKSMIESSTNAIIAEHSAQVPTHYAAGRVL